MYDSSFGIVAAVVALLSHVFYIIAIIKGETKPSRVTWFIWAMLGTILATSYYYSGARTTLWLPAVEAISYITIAILSIKYGVGGWTTIDKIALIGAASSALLWYLSGSPVITLIAALIIDFMAAAPTIYKSFKDPETEDRTAWVLTVIGSIMNFIAINEWSLSIAIYPVYMLTMNGFITILLFRKPKSQQNQIL